MDAIVNTHPRTQEKQMSATPYELRANLLKQAEGLLVRKYDHECDRIKYLLHEGHADIKTITYPVYPTSEEIIVEAEKLYIFVQTK